MGPLPFVKQRRKTSSPDACNAEIVEAKKMTSSSGWAVTSSTLPGLRRGVSASRSKEPEFNSSRKVTPRLSNPVANTRLLHRLRSSDDLLPLYSFPPLPASKLPACSAGLLASVNICSQPSAGVLTSDHRCIKLIAFRATLSLLRKLTPCFGVPRRRDQPFLRRWKLRLCDGPGW